MATIDNFAGANQPNERDLRLSADEKRYFKQLFEEADTERIGVVTGEVAVKFFERTNVPSPILGIIWQIADTENRGLLTSAGFCIVLRLIGHFQQGREPTEELAYQPAPLPKFDGLNGPAVAAPKPAAPIPQPIQPQISGPIRVPPLSPEKATEYSSLFDKYAKNGILGGDAAKSIFEKAGLSNEMLSRIWNLADTEQRGALGVTEFVLAMHLLVSVKTNAMIGVPANLPAGLYEAASRRTQPLRGPVQGVPSAIPRQFSGQNNQRTSSPLGRSAYGAAPQSIQSTGNDWAITAQEKASFDNHFRTLDKEGRGFITGEQAVAFFMNSGLQEDTLAAIWDLADINSAGQLSRDEFAVAMYLIRQQRDPTAVLPTTLPANLIPPSMRRQTRPPQRSTAPAFDNALASPQMTKSAADDLFGLDSFSAPPAVPAPQQQQQSTGGSATFNRPFDNDPFGSKTSSPTSPTFQSRNQAPGFKPFMPTSSFGQSLASKPGQGTSSPLAQSRELPQKSPAMDDLLGDNDPEVSNKLTQETTELANMSNQIGTLRTQMQEVQSRKGSTEKELAGASTQKRDLELRLSQFRTQYEQEVKNVKALEERLNTSRAETRKLQQEYALVEGSYQDLQNEYRQKAAAYEADQRENANLKEKMRTVNNEINNLKPQLEKLRSDSRQQKGMVAINKKQLATNEQERDKLRNEANDLSKTAEASRSPFPIATPQDSNVASPAPSTVSASTNPFFRKSPAPGPEAAMSPSGFPRSDNLANSKDFDNIFGPSSSAAPASAAPTTSFRNENQPGSSVRSSEPDVPTPSTSPPLSSYHESPRTVDPPPPPESRQFGSNFLPLREAVSRTDSLSSSVKVSAPASRYDEPTGTETPTASATSSGPKSRPETSRGESSSYGATLFERNRAASPAASTASDANQVFGAPSASQIPGAFPRDVGTPLQSELTGDSAQSKGTNRTDPFAAKDQPRNQGAKADFDSAFADFKPKQVQERQNTGSSAGGSVDPNQNRFNKEFPPIEEFGRDEDSDSNDERGFDDNFTPASPKPPPFQETASRPTTSTTATDGAEERPSLTQRSTELPGPDAQQSPPTYGDTFSQQRSGSNQFPPEFGGLLPARSDPTQEPPHSIPSTEKGFGSQTTGGSQGQALFGQPSSSSKPSAPNTTFSGSPPPTDTPTSTVPSDAYHSTVSHPSSHPSATESAFAQSSNKAAFHDDFDSGFDDLSEAKEADDKTDDDFFGSSQHREGIDEFNPVFDSPAASKSNTMASQQTPTGNQSFGNDSDFGSMSQSFAQSSRPQPTETSHDWDAIFGGLDSSADRIAPAGESSKPAFPSFGEPAAESSKLASQPPLNRALSNMSEHDDPIVKQFTNMGFPRSKVVPALEKFDYDMDKTGEYLASEAK